MEVITGIITLQMIFSKYWQSFKNWYKGKIRKAVIDNVEKILKCRTGLLGFHAYKCRYIPVLPLPVQLQFQTRSHGLQSEPVHWALWKKEPGLN